jgi:hypothetical protein
MFMEMKIGVPTIRQVTSPEHDWIVLYFGNRKIWEGGNWNDEAFEAIATSLGAKFYSYEFTDEDEIDGETPDSFMHIKGIKELM